MLKAQDGTDYKKQFQAAVDVIQNLPKNGPYRPSYEVMLRFYSYYKQATMGRCNISRPGFWDPIGRYKWDAWNGLGDLTQEEAMAAYIREMKIIAQKIINTVPMEEASSNMFHFFEPLYQMIPDMPRPPEHLFRRINGCCDRGYEFSSNNETNENDLPVSLPAEPEEGMDRLAPLGEEQQHLKDESQQGNPEEGTYIVIPVIGEEKKEEDNVTVPQTQSLDLEETRKIGETSLAGETVDRRQVTSDSETEVYCDSLDQLEHSQSSAVMESDFDQQMNEESLYSFFDNEYKNSAVKQTTSVGSQVGRKAQSAELGSATAHRFQTSREMNFHVTTTIRRLQEDTQALQFRLNHLEAKVAEKKLWWQSLGGSGPTLLFLVVWPFLVQWLLHKYQNRKK